MTPIILVRAALSAALFLTAPAIGLAKTTYPPVEVLLSASETIIGQPIVYPTDGAAKITAAIVTMQPGQSTGAHLHNVPLFGYMLEGELTVDYGADGTRVYQAGDSLLEAVGSLHNGTNTGAGIMRVLVVFAGAEGVTNTQSASD